MKRSSLNFIIDLTAFVNLLALAFTAFIIKFILPPGSGARGLGFRAGRASQPVKEFWSMTRHQWGDIHFYLALLFLALIIIHIILHWTWLKNYFKSHLSLSQNEAKL